MGEISVRLPASRRAPVTPPPPRLTRPPPRPQMMPEGLVLVGVPQTLPPQPPQTPNLCVSQENLAIALRFYPPDGQGRRCSTPSSHACASNFSPVSPSLSLVLADPGCRADQGPRFVALYGHRVAGRLQLVERGPLGAVRPPPRRRVAPRAPVLTPFPSCLQDD